MHLRADVQVARILDDLVILDLRADDYLLLTGHAADLHLIGRTLAEGTSIRCRDALASAGLLGGRASRNSSPEVRDWAPPVADVWDRTETPSRRDARLLLRMVPGTLCAFAGRPVRRLLGRSPSRGALGARAEAEDVEATAAAAARFRRLMVWSPWQGACLFRAFLLRRFLRDQGMDAAWVFGVRTWPFQAHCWLQHRGVVLDDHIERVSAFTPILIN